MLEKYLHLHLMFRKAFRHFMELALPNLVSEIALVNLSHLEITVILFRGRAHIT